MAKQFDYEILPTLSLADVYAIVGETRVNHFHQTVEIDFYIFISEDARNQLVDDFNLRRPLKVITVRPPIQFYQEYIESSADAIAAACYDLLTNVPEVNDSNPFGLSTLLADAVDV